MDFQEELSKFKLKNFSEESIKNKINEDLKSRDISQVESSIKNEIRKSSLILQNKIDSLQEEISNLNLENEELKKQLFRSNRELEKITNLLFSSIDIYIPLEVLLNESKEREIIKLMEKKLDGLLQKNNLEKTAKIGEKFDHKYHEVLNENLEKKDVYTIKTVVSQGYIKEGKIIKTAKVTVE